MNLVALHLVPVDRRLLVYIQLKYFIDMQRTEWTQKFRAICHLVYDIHGNVEYFTVL